MKCVSVALDLNSTRNHHHYMHNTTYLPVAGAHFVLTHVILFCAVLCFLFFYFIHSLHAISIGNSSHWVVVNECANRPHRKHYHRHSDGNKARYTLRISNDPSLGNGSGNKTEKRQIYISGLIRWFVSTNEKKRRTTIYLVHVWRNLIAVIKTTKKI